MCICTNPDLVNSQEKLPQVDSSKTKCHPENLKTLRKPCECHKSCTNTRTTDHVGMAQLKRTSLKSKGIWSFCTGSNLSQ